MEIKAKYRSKIKLKIKSKFRKTVTFINKDTNSFEKLKKK